MYYLPETRWKAFGLHIAASLILFFLLAILIIFFWYPGYLFNTDGGWQGIRMIAGIDFILGPFLTLLIYKKGKKGLKFDLTLIAIVQLSALGYGTHLVYKERPIAIIFANDTFVSMSNSSFEFHHVDWQSIDLLINNKKPVWVIVSKNGENSTALSKPEEGLYQHLDIQNYRKLEPSKIDFENKGRLKVRNLPALPEEQAARYFKMSSRYFEGYLLVDTLSGTVRKHFITNRIMDVQVSKS